MKVNGSGLSPGSKRTFFCSHANIWEIWGEKEITCLENGQWNAPSPTCKLKGQKKDNIWSTIFGCNFSYDFSVECGRVDVTISTYIRLLVGIVESKSVKILFNR